VTAALVLDRVAARAATDRLRLTLTDAHEQLIELYRSRAHEALGYGTGVPGWTAYCAAEFGELLHVLPTDDQLAAMAAAGMPQRAICATYGVGLGTVNERLKRRRAQAAPAAAGQRAAVPAHVRVAELVAASGARGLTIPQVMRRAGMRYGAASGALSRAEARGLVVRLWAAETKRDGYRPYVSAPPR
jgi:hypothetical protein